MTETIVVPQVLNKYHVKNKLGSGGFSVVYRVVDTVTMQEYACKICPKSNIANEKDRARFQREIDAMTYLQHENLVALRDFLSDDVNYYLIMDLCQGNELLEYITNNGKLDEKTAAVIFKQMIVAISYCHSVGVAHRDLKPENILFTEFPKLKIADFGLCGYVSEKAMMKTFCGSPCYAAPECLCKMEYDGRLSDIWSAGVILYFMVTGQPPWNVANMSLMSRQIVKGQFTFKAKVSSECRNLIEGIMNVDPKLRLSIEQILSHPFMKLADGTDVSLPTEPGRSIREISESVHRKSDETGIIPPIGGDRVEETTTGRSCSVENLKLARQGSGTVRRRNFMPVRRPIGMQKSEFSLRPRGLISQAWLVK